jgi:hypothetical protein
LDKKFVLADQGIYNFFHANTHTLYK